MYEDQTVAAIKQRMIDAVPSDLDKREGSFIYDGLSPAAIELALAYIEMDRVIKLGFAQTTYGQYLDYRAAEHGVTR
ncbi:MAG: baseplate J protein, partial [Firmicutes bacterium]|nr:baseplate J protein [Bacillota bacterium]